MDGLLGHRGGAEDLLYTFFPTGGWDCKPQRLVTFFRRRISDRHVYG